MPKVLRITTVYLSLKKLLSGQLDYMKENGLQVYTACAGNINSDQHFDLKHLTRKINLIKDVLAIKEVVRIIRNVRPEIIHTHTPKAGLIGMVAGWICRVPIRMHTVAGLPLMEKTGVWQKVLIFIEKIIYWFATSVHPNSNGLKEFIFQNISKNNKISIIGKGTSNGINLDEFHPSQVNSEKLKLIKEKLRDLNNSMKFCFIGRLVGDKGINELVDAFSSHQKKYPNSSLILVGPYEDNLDPLLIETKETIETNPSIIDFGFQSDVRPFISVSDVLVFPSYREGFPNVPMQFAAFRKPMILSNIYGCDQIVDDEKSGFLVPIKQIQPLVEKMEFLQDNPGIGKKMGDKAYTNLKENYSQKEVWKAILDTYKSKLSKLN
jgi:glycosyltransferase involved in cell wall biosynthesis